MTKILSMVSHKNYNLNANDLMYLMLVYNYVVKSHHPHTTQSICRIPGTSTSTPNPCRIFFPSLLSCSRTGMFVGLQHNNTTCSGWGSYCFQISSVVWALRKSNVVPANRQSLWCFDGKYVDSTFVVDARIGDIAVHPQKRNQFAIRAWAHQVVYVIEPSHELGGEWVCKANQGVGGQIRIN